MKGCLLHISGSWAHFKKPETNNNPLTHDFITKTALIGLIGAVLGKDREEMKPLFPQLSEDLLYGVSVENPVKKESWAFTMRRVYNLYDKAPKQMEFLRNPSFLVAICLLNERSNEHFDRFIHHVANSESHYTPVLGLHNCPATVQLKAHGNFRKERSPFETTGFITNHQKPILQAMDSFRFGFDRMPTYQNNDFWNLPDRYIDVIYAPEGRSLQVQESDHYLFSDNSAWILI